MEAAGRGREGKVDAVLAGGFLDVDEAGRRWGHCVRDACWAMNTAIHDVNDGALWIDHQIDDVLGLDVSKSWDFYHVSDSICAAAKSIAAEDPKSWSTRQCRHLETGEVDIVINELAEHLEPAQILAKQAPLPAASRYLNNRRDSLGYAEAIEKGLANGSGLIKAGHKHVLQARPRKAGTAWLEATARLLAPLRVLRGNNLWDPIWN